MGRFSLPVLALLCLAPAAAASDDVTDATPHAGLSSPSWPGIVIDYDPASWRPQAVPGSVHTHFTCIAEDCVEEPAVLFQAWSLPDDPAAEFCHKYQSDEDDYDDRMEIGDPERGEIRFTMLRMWSGCRAADAPIYDACGAIAGHAYRFTTRDYGYGCNFEPQVPVGRFIDLLKSVRPAPAGVAR